MTEDVPEKDGALEARGPRRGGSYLSPSLKEKRLGGNFASFTNQQSEWCRPVANMYVCCKKRFSCPCRLLVGGLAVCQGCR